MDINSKQFWIFLDLDGTLVDTLPVLKKTFFNFIKELGGKGSTKDFDNLNGASLEEAICYFKKKLGLLPSRPYLKSSYRKELNNIYKKIRPRRGAKLALQKLNARGWRLALVTSASRKLATDFLKRNRLTHLFEFIVSGEEVSYGKPNSQIYKLAKTRAGKGIYIAVEDSKNGMIAAEKSGCLALNFQPGSKYFFGISSFADLARRLQIIDKTPFLIRRKAKTKFSVFYQNKNINNLAIPGKIQKKIDKFWAQEKLKNPHLYDGRIFTPIKEKSPNSFEAVWVPFRYIYYQLRKKGCVAAMRGAVTGIVKWRRKVLILRRSNLVTEYQGINEFAPSGCLESNSISGENKLNPRLQVIKELKEELGISRSAIANLRSFYLIFDIKHRLFDLIYLITLKKSAHPGLGIGGEHIEIRLVSFRDLKKEVYKNPAKFIPLVKLYFNLRKI